MFIAQWIEQLCFYIYIYTWNEAGIMLNSSLRYVDRADSRHYYACQTLYMSFLTEAAGGVVTCFWTLVQEPSLPLVK